MPETTNHETANPFTIIDLSSDNDNGEEISQEGLPNGNERDDSSQYYTQFTQRIITSIFLIRQPASSHSNESLQESSQRDNSFAQIALSRMLLLPYLFHLGGGLPDDEQSFDDILERLLALHQPQGIPPASRETIEKIPTIIIDQQTKNEAQRCSVCFEDFQIGAGALKLPCSHIFDKECLTTWLNQHNSCPMCRRELPADPNTEPKKEYTENEDLAAQQNFQPTTEEDSNGHVNTNEQIDLTGPESEQDSPTPARKRKRTPTLVQTQSSKSKRKKTQRTKKD